MITPQDKRYVPRTGARKLAQLCERKDGKRPERGIEIVAVTARSRGKKRDFG